MINIRSNGSTWAGEELDTIEALLATLASEPLDRRFEDCGNFVITDPELVDGTVMVGITNFFGNFLTVSHVFNIDTDDAELISTLTAAILANQERPDYRSQPKPKARKRA